MKSKVGKNVNTKRNAMAGCCGVALHMLTQFLHRSYVSIFSEIIRNIFFDHDINRNAGNITYQFANKRKSGVCECVSVCECSTVDELFQSVDSMYVCVCVQHATLKLCPANYSQCAICGLMYARARSTRASRRRETD